MHRASRRMSYLLRPRLSISRSQLPRSVRLQHGVSHEEYFQNGQMPKPETHTSPSRSNVGREGSHESSLWRRIWSSTGVGVWFFIFGFGAGTSLITWAYLQGPFEAGSEEENDMLEEITDMMNEHPVMEVLLTDPEWEEWPSTPRMVSGDAGKGLNFVTGTLTGSKGIIQVFLPPKIPYHPF
jgi:hypothetical protein